jgi:hypothetical protein
MCLLVSVTQQSNSSGNDYNMYINIHIWAYHCIHRHLWAHRSQELGFVRPLCPLWRRFRRGWMTSGSGPERQLWQDFAWVQRQDYYFRRFCSSKKCLLPWKHMVWSFFCINGRFFQSDQIWPKICQMLFVYINRYINVSVVHNNQDFFKTQWAFSVNFCV